MLRPTLFLFNRVAKLLLQLEAFSLVTSHDPSHCSLLTFEASLRDCDRAALRQGTVIQGTPPLHQAESITHISVLAAD